MTPRDFCYWLQGYFELVEMVDDPVTELTAKQTQAVIDHLNLVHACNPRMDIKDKCNGFMYVLKGFLQSHSDMDPKFTLRNEDLDFVRDMLEEIFEHVIDPTHGTPEQQAKLKKIHDGKDDGYKTIMRC